MKELRKEQKQRLLLCFGSVFFWGLLAQGAVASGWGDCSGHRGMLGSRPLSARRENAGLPWVAQW